MNKSIGALGTEYPRLWSTRHNRVVANDTTRVSPAPIGTPSQTFSLRVSSHGFIDDVFIVPLASAATASLRCPALDPG